MAVTKSKSRFESEVRLGLLVIIFLLFFLNFLSNFIILRARSTKRDESTAQFRAIATSVARQLTRGGTGDLSEDERSDVVQTYRLNSVDVVPTGPDDESIESRRQWFTHLSPRLPAGKVQAFAAKLLGSEFEQLARGDGSEYFYVSPYHKSGASGLIILARDVPDLAYIEDSQRNVVYISIASILAIFSVYLLLSRRIFSPFRLIKERAIIAGRPVEDETDDAEAVVREYRLVIDELQEKEQQLLALNRTIQRKADSLEQFNDYLVQSMRSGLITVGLDGRIVTFNDAAAALLEHDRHDCVGRHYREVFPPGSPLGEAIRTLLTDNAACEYAEIICRTPIGHELTLGMSTSAIHDADHAPIGGAVLLHDLTEIVRLRSELETGHRLSALGEMAGGLAHQLRNSMGAIGGYLTLLKRRLAKKGVNDPAVEELAEEARQADDLIKRFLQFARPLALDPEPVSIQGFLADIVSGFAVRGDLGNVRIVVQDAPDTTIDADLLLLKQAVTNLVENAAKAYDGDAGEVRLAAHADSGSLSITVSDRGCGIPAENLDKIFTPFFSSRPSGNGLGLPLARKIVDLHGGRLLVESAAGEGTIFTVQLPIRVHSTHVFRS